MMASTLRVSLITSTDCYLRLPRALAERVAARTRGTRGCAAFRLRWRNPDESADRVAYFGWGEQVARTDAVEVPRAVAECAGMADAADADPAFVVSIELVEYCPPAPMVSVVPASASDWELVEARADLVTATMLSQIAVVHRDQLFPVWIGRRCVHLRVVGELPAACALMVRDVTDVVVAPVNRPPPAGASSGVAGGALPPQADWPSVTLRAQPMEIAASAQSWDNSVDALVHPSTYARFPGVETCLRKRDAAALVALIQSAEESAAAAAAGGGSAATAEAPPQTARGGYGNGVANGRSGALSPSAVLVCLRCAGAAEAATMLPDDVLLPFVVRAQLRLPALARVQLRLLRADGDALGGDARDGDGEANAQAPALVGESGASAAAPRLELTLSPLRWLGADGTAREVEQRWRALRHGAAANVATSKSADEAAGASILARSFSHWLAARGEDAVPIVRGAIVTVPLRWGERSDVRGGGGHRQHRGKLRAVDVLLRTSAAAPGGSHWMVAASALRDGCVALRVGTTRSVSFASTGAALADASASALPAAAASAARDAPSPVGCGPPGFNAARRLTDLAGVEEEANALLADIRPLAAMPSAMRRVRMLRAPAAGIGAVLVGGSGSGKSALASGVAAQLRAAHSPAAAVRTVWLDCRSLRGSSNVSVRRRLAAAWSATLARAPALLVLDDADLVMPAPSGEGHGPESESFIACLPLHRNSGFLTDASESTHHVRLPPPAPARRAPSR